MCTAKFCISREAHSGLCADHLYRLGLPLQARRMTAEHWDTMAGYTRLDPDTGRTFRPYRHLAARGRSAGRAALV